MTVSAELKSQLNDMLVKGIEEFFESTPLKVSRSEKTNVESKGSLVSMIGFTGSDMVGNLVVICNREELRASHPFTAYGMPLEDDALPDWCGEIANQVLGRIKAILNLHSVELEMATPSILEGQNVDIVGKIKGTQFRNTYVGDGNPISVVFIADIRADLKLRPKDEQRKFADEGELKFMNASEPNMA